MGLLPRFLVAIPLHGAKECEAPIRRNVNGRLTLSDAGENVAMRMSGLVVVGFDKTQEADRALTGRARRQDKGAAAPLPLGVNPAAAGLACNP